MIKDLNELIEWIELDNIVYKKDWKRWGSVEVIDHHFGGMFIITDSFKLILQQLIDKGDGVIVYKKHLVN